MNWQKVLDKLSIPGLILLALGAVMALRADKLCRDERLQMAVRFSGLLMALYGAAVLLDAFPGL